MIRALPSLLLLFSCLAFAHCSKEEAGAPCPPVVLTAELSPCAQTDLLLQTLTFSDQPVFNRDLVIRIPAYAFAAPDGRVYQARGDESLPALLAATACCDIAGALDALPPRPQLAWEFTGHELIAAAIFERDVELVANGASIANVEDAVWLWNSGMGGANAAGNRVRVDFSDGRDVLNGQVQPTVTPLDSGRLYRWLVWAWNDTGTQVVASSRAIPFLVGGLPGAPLTDHHQVLGRWETEEVRTLDGAADLQGLFPYTGFVVEEMNCTPEGVPVLGYRFLPSGLPGEAVLTDGFDWDLLTAEGIDFVREAALRCDDHLTAEIGFSGKVGRVAFRRVE